MGITQFNLNKNICFYKYAHNSGPKGSPDMILSAFDMTFHDKNEGIPPRACKPRTKIKQIQKMHQEMGAPPARPPERGFWGLAPPREEKKGMFPTVPFDA